MPPRRKPGPKANGGGGPKTRNTKIKYIEDNEKRAATQSKRTTGLLKKAVELHVLSGAEVFVFVQQKDVDPKGKGPTKTRSRIYSSSSDNWIVSLDRLRDNVAHSAATVQAMRTRDYKDTFKKNKSHGRGKDRSLEETSFSYSAADQSELMRVAEETRQQMLPPADNIDLVLVDNGEVPQRSDHPTRAVATQLQVVPPQRAPGDTRYRNPRKERLRRGLRQIDRFLGPHPRLQGVLKAGVRSGKKRGMYKCHRPAPITARLQHHIRLESLRVRQHDYEIAQLIEHDAIQPLQFRKAVNWLDTCHSSPSEETGKFLPSY